MYSFEVLTSDKLVGLFVAIHFSVCISFLFISVLYWAVLGCGLTWFYMALDGLGWSWMVLDGLRSS